MAFTGAQFDLEDLEKRGISSTFDDYAEMVIQFG
jgi:hypothetical protein